MSLPCLLLADLHRLKTFRVAENTKVEDEGKWPQKGKCFQNLGIVLPRTKIKLAMTN